jgi:hypothetical protein
MKDTLNLLLLRACSGLVYLLSCGSGKKTLWYNFKNLAIEYKLEYKANAKINKNTNI